MNNYEDVYRLKRESYEFSNNELSSLDNNYSQDEMEFSLKPFSNMFEDLVENKSDDLELDFQFYSSEIGSIHDISDLTGPLKVDEVSSPCFVPLDQKDVSIIDRKSQHF